MRIGRQLAFLLFAVTLCPAQVVVDRMVAVVNKRVILESELDQAVRVEALLQGKPFNKDKPDLPDTPIVLDRMIDRSLLDQQIIQSDMLDPTPEELAARVKEVRGKVPGAVTDEGWKVILSSYGLIQQDIEDHVLSEFRVLRFIDLRFRGLVRVDKAAIAVYYQEKLLPELARQGAAEPPLAEVSDKIERVLVEQRMGEMLDEWMQTLRAQAHIEKMVASGSNPAHGANP